MKVLLTTSDIFKILDLSSLSAALVSESVKVILVLLKHRNMICIIQVHKNCHITYITALARRDLKFLMASKIKDIGHVTRKVT